ncbi:MAG: transglutaminase domain-containing protein [Myxococcota bacterium]
MTRSAAPALRYYAQPGALTDLGAHAASLRDLPHDLAGLCRVVQGLLVHPFLGHLYGLDSKEMRHDELETRAAVRMVDRILALDSSPLAQARAPERRLVGNCRHFTVLLCALLRARGVASRARCGFAAWFDRSNFTDHWVCEVWDEARGSWVLVDAQLDREQRKAFGIAFDPLDVPRTEFLVGGDAWQRCRSEGADPNAFGIMDLRGLWFVRGDVVRDLAALAKRELLPWDGWGLMVDRHESDARELALLDRVAALTLAGDEQHAERLAIQASDPGLRVPREVINFNLGGAKVELPPGVANEARALEELFAAVAAWAEVEPTIAAVALVGSHARGEARPDSAVDLVVLCDDVDAFAAEPRWIQRFGAPSRHALERWGAVSSIRVWYATGLEVEFGFTAPSWAAAPLDAGTRRVVTDGLRVVFDRNGILNGLSLSRA